MGFGSEHQRRGNVGRRSFLKGLGLFAAVPAFGRRLTTGTTPASAAPAGAAGPVSLPSVPAARTAARAPVQDKPRCVACLRAGRALLLVGPGGGDRRLE